MDETAWEILNREEGCFYIGDTLLHKNGYLLLVMKRTNGIGFISVNDAISLYEKGDITCITDDDGALYPL
ncbi:hypothetical protein [Rummeliibacillus stabekisii]|uniref:hypothetical protein n=1 Tax=Rummeliibacillus stabekisii TaxID=241244 RepID=UPI00371BF418